MESHRRTSHSRVRTIFSLISMGWMILSMWAGGDSLVALALTLPTKPPSSSNPSTTSSGPSVVSSSSPFFFCHPPPPITTSRVVVAWTRRKALLSGLCFSGAATALWPPPPAAAVEVTTTLGSSSSSSSTSTLSSDPLTAEVTDRVFMDVRISRADGTFYVRDDEDEESEDNRVFTGRLVFGLFGKNAPNHVQRFLSYIPDSARVDDDQEEEKEEDEAPRPTYGRSLFTRFDQATGLLQGGIIPSLEVTEINGATALRYGKRLLPAPLWLERGGSTHGPPLSHQAKGLLTHAALDVTPAFGITTRSESTAAAALNHHDGSSPVVVFGRILWDDSSRAFVSRIQDLPTYQIDRPARLNLATTTSNNNNNNNNEGLVSSAAAVDQVAEAVFNAQRDFFRNFAKTVGDGRLDRIYEGKILRRVEVTQVGRL